MDNSQIVDLAQRAIFVGGIVVIPILLVTLVVGLIISIFQSSTQIHEQTLTFVPKILAVLLLLVLMGGWMVSELSGFTREVFNAVANM